MTVFWSFTSIVDSPGNSAMRRVNWKIGDGIRLGELRGGALHYDPDWHERPLWLMAAGTGLGPLFGVLREALRQDHQGAIRVIHLAHDANEHYLAKPCKPWRRTGRT